MTAKRWVQISVEADRGSVDDLVGFLGRHCLGGAVVEYKPAEMAHTAGGHATVKGFLPACEEETARKLEIALLLLAQTNPISVPQVRLLEPCDWSESWKAFFPPQHIGSHTVIVPTWHEYLPGPDEVVIRLDPGMAFGTGLHATTRLCLIALERLVRRGKVLDVGTGSGILAIAAALHGVRAAKPHEKTSVRAIDIDPVAVKVARENVALNRVGDVVQVDQGTLGIISLDDVLADSDGYDLVLINILAETIAEMAPALARVMRAGAAFCASGVLCEKAGMVTRALIEAGLALDDRLQDDDWVALIGHKT